MYIKWVGGKSSIAEDLILRFPTKIDYYIEPFFGSGSMYFKYYDYLEQNLYNDLKPVFFVSDKNKYLINCHNCVKNNFPDLKIILESIEKDYNLCQDKSLFYKEKRDLVTSDDLLQQNHLVSAAIFLFINKTCFNGLWRVNKKGKYNVPTNKLPFIKFNYQNIQLASEFLQKANIHCGSYEFYFDELLKNKKNIFYYIDPPYIPLNTTSSFTAYTEDGFSENDTSNLEKFCTFLNSNGVKWMVSNSSSQSVYSIFSKWKINEIEVPRLVKAVSKGGKRFKVKETIITNY